jgi:hypothetical protein
MLAVNCQNVLATGSNLSISRAGCAEGGHRRCAIILALLFIMSPLSLGCSTRAGGVQLATPPADHFAQHGSTSKASPPSENILCVQILSSTFQTSANPPLQRIDIGTVRQGDTVRRTLIVKNLTQTQVVIDRFETSCDCLKLTGVPMTIDAGKESRIAAELDESHESEFCGNLAIEANGYRAAAPALRLLVSANVVAGPDDRSLAY